MRTIKGLPTSVVVDSENALREVERLMLRASRSVNLTEKDAENLIDTYKSARRQWLDAHYAFSEEHLRALQAADERIAAAVRETIDIVCRTLKREGSLPEEERTISTAYVHLEEDGVPIEYLHRDEMTEDEEELWYLLFREEERFACFDWGFPFSRADIDNVDEWRAESLKMLEKDSEHHLSKLFLRIAKRYRASLHDMARIGKFKLTIGYELR